MVATLTQRVEADAPSSKPGGTGVRPAGLWQRAAALVVDLAVAWGLVRVGELAGGTLASWPDVRQAFTSAYTLVVPTAYFVLSHGTGGQTVGKRLLHVRLTGISGQPVGYGRALGRQVAWELSAILLLGLGHLLAAVRPDKRALHDLVAGTRVVRTR